MRRGAAIVFAFAFLLSGCSKFSAQSGVDVKAIPIDLAFGKPPVTQQPQAPLPELPPLLLPPPELPPPPQHFAAAPLCPPVSAIAARDIALTSVPGPDDTVWYNALEKREGAYLYDYVWNYINQPENQHAGGMQFKDLATKLDNYQNSTPGGFTFDVSDLVDPRIMMGFGSWAEDHNAATNGQGQPDQQDHDGFFFQHVIIPKDTKGTENDDFRSQDQLIKIMDYPITEGQHFSTSAPDTAVKPGQQIPNPVTGGFVPNPGQGTLTVTSDVGSRQIVAVCDQLAQAWEVNIEIKADEPNSPYSFDLAGKFWFDTAYGGLPVREDFTITGSLIQGNFFSQMMRLDPGEYA